MTTKYGRKKSSGSSIPFILSLIILFLVGYYSFTYININHIKYGPEVDRFYEYMLEKKLPSYCILEHISGRNIQYNRIEDDDKHINFTCTSYKDSDKNVTISTYQFDKLTNEIIRGTQWQREVNINSSIVESGLNGSPKDKEILSSTLLEHDVRKIKEVSLSKREDQVEYFTNNYSVVQELICSEKFGESTSIKKDGGDLLVTCSSVDTKVTFRYGIPELVDYMFDKEITNLPKEKGSFKHN